MKVFKTTKSISRTKLFGSFFGVLLLIALSVTLGLTQQMLNLRQQASAQTYTPVSGIISNLTLSKGNCTTIGTYAGINAQCTITYSNGSVMQTSYGSNQGCQTGSALISQAEKSCQPVIPTPTIATCPGYGSYYSTYCLGTTKYERYSDGKCGYITNSLGYSSSCSVATPTPYLAPTLGPGCPQIDTDGKTNTCRPTTSGCIAGEQIKLAGTLACSTYLNMNAYCCHKL